MRFDGFPQTTQLIGIVILFFAVNTIVFIIAVSKLYKKAGLGQAIIRNGLGGPKVSFGGIFVFPAFHNYQLIDISVKRIQVNCNGKNKILCKDNVLMEIQISFLICINHAMEDIIHVAQALGNDATFDKTNTLFISKFDNIIRTVAKKYDFVELNRDRDKFIDEIIKTTGTPLNGYILDDVVIDYLRDAPESIAVP